MWKEAVAETGIIFYLMLGVGIVGILAKVMNYVTLRKLVNAAGSMSKSTHKLMKLVRAKYEHACMVHDRVENVNAFVEKYIYEYRGFFLKIHTWRQIQIQSIWFAGILAAIGAVGHFMAHGFCEQVYQYGALGAAEMVALFVISQLSDESYKIEAAENYMVDYLENVCLRKYEKMNQKERTVRVNIENGPAEDEIQKGEIQKDEIQKDEIQRDEVQETEAGTEETPAPVPDHSVVHMQRENRRRERTQNTAKNLAKASAGLAGMDGSKSPEAEEQKDAPEELAKDEMIRQILREFMA